MRRHAYDLIGIISAIFAATPVMASAQSVAQVTINPQIPYLNPNLGLPGMIQGFYLFALSIAGILAFGAIVYGGVKYATGRGNPSAESEGKSWITSALLGLLLLGGAYVILQTVNPALTTLTLPGLPALGVPSTTSGVYTPPPTSTLTYACIPTSGGEGLYNGPGTAGNSNSWSAGLASVMRCVQPAISGFGGTAPWTTNGQHACRLPNSISCHFGGSCNDGGHAFDIDVPNNSLSLLQKAKAAALQCGQTTGQQIYCRCESQNGAQLDPSCTQSYDNHVHCNVDNTSCGCN